MHSSGRRRRTVSRSELLELSGGFEVELVADGSRIDVEASMANAAAAIDARNRRERSTRRRLARPFWAWIGHPILRRVELRHLRFVVESLGPADLDPT